MEELVERYVKLRDAKTRLKAKHGTEMAPLDDAMDKIEAVILEQFNAQGIESARTVHGTAYKQVRSSASVAEWDPLLAFIRDNDLWHMLEKRVAKAAVEQYRDEHNDLPPGIKWSEEVVVNIRKS